MHINARSALESAGFIPVLIRFLRRTGEFSEEEKGDVAKHVEERENVTLTVRLFVPFSFCIAVHSLRGFCV